MKPNGPPSQSAKYQVAPAPAPHNSNYSLSYAPPRGPAIDTRPAAKTPWGHQTGLGYATDRLVVQTPVASLMPDMRALLCAAGGFLIYSVLIK